jgi:hypothetical protein
MSRKHSKWGRISNLEFGVGEIAPQPPDPVLLTGSQTKNTSTEGEFIVGTLATVNWVFKADESVDFKITLSK